MVLHGYTPLSRKPLLCFTYTWSKGMTLVEQQNPAVATLQRFVTTLYMRRLWRAACNVVLVGLFCSALPLLRWRYTQDSIIKLSGAEEITLTLTHCDLTFSAVSVNASGTFSPTLVASMGSSFDGSSLKRTGNVIDARRGHGSLVRCELILYYSQHHQLPRITIFESSLASGSSSCAFNETNTSACLQSTPQNRMDAPTIRGGDPSAPIRAMGLSVFGVQADVDIRGLRRDVLQVHLESGRVVLSSSAFIDATIRITTGDALVTTTQNIHVSLISSSPYFCFVAPYATVSNLTMNNATHEQNALLCASVCSTSEPEQHATLTAELASGVLHATVYDNYDLNSENSTVENGLPEMVAFLSDASSPFQLSEIPQFMLENAGGDGVVQLELTGIGQDVGKWLFFSNRALRYMPVWLLRALSLNIVGPRTARVRLRALSPGNCPHQYWHKDDAEILGPISRAIQNELTKAENLSGIVLLRPYLSHALLEYEPARLGAKWWSVKQFRMVDNPMMIALVCSGLVRLFTLNAHMLS